MKDRINRSPKYDPERRNEHIGAENKEESCSQRDSAEHKDVIAYLENRKVFPESYSAPAGWYKGDYTVQMEEQVPQIVLEHLRLYYTELLSDYPDVLTIQTVSKITGYGKTAINNWCNQGYIKSFRKNNVNHIPKVYLMEFFCSTFAPSPANHRGTSAPCKAFQTGGKSVTCTRQRWKEVRNNGKCSG